MGFSSSAVPRVFCIGRNYAEHVKELGNDVAEPVIFMKPPTSLVTCDSTDIPYPDDGDLDYETELVVEIGMDGKPSDEIDAVRFISALGVGFDLTKRNVQKFLRSNNLPWEISKSFDFSAPVGRLTPFDPSMDVLERLTFSGFVNGVLRQKGTSSDMICSIPKLLLDISKYWKLMKGDLIYTGTPHGVGKLNRGDVLSAVDHRGNTCSWRIG